MVPTAPTDTLTADNVLLREYNWDLEVHLSVEDCVTIIGVPHIEDCVWKIDEN